MVALSCEPMTCLVTLSGAEDRVIFWVKMDLGGLCVWLFRISLCFFEYIVLFRFLWVAKNQPCLEKWLRAFFGEFLSWSQKYSWQHFWNQSRFPNEHCGSKKPQPPFQRFPPRTKTTEKNQTARFEEHISKTVSEGTKTWGAIVKFAFKRAHKNIFHDGSMGLVYLPTSCLNLW